MPVELTDSARRKAQKHGLLDTPVIKAGTETRDVGEKIIRRETANSMALDAARRAQGLGKSKKSRQSTDSNQ